MSIWESPCTVWGGLRSQAERPLGDCVIKGTNDSFTLTHGRKVIAEGDYLGALTAAGEDIYFAAARSSEWPAIQRILTVTDRPETSARSVAKTSFTIVAARITGDEGFEPDGTRLMVLSRVSNTAKWSAGIGGSGPLKQLAEILKIELAERSVSLTVDYLGGEPSRTSAIGGATLVARAATLALLAPKTKTEVFHLNPVDLQAISLGDHDRMKTLIDRGSMSATGAGIGAIGGAALGPLLGPGDSGSLLDYVDDGAGLGLLVGVAASFMSSKTSRNHFVLVAAEREGFRFQTAFLAAPEDARLLVSEVQAQRFAAGLAALPDVGDLVHHEALRAQQRQAELLENLAAGSSVRGTESEALDPIAQIERLAGLRDRGLVSDEEFEAKRIELLSRI